MQHKPDSYQQYISYITQDFLCDVLYDTGNSVWQLLLRPHAYQGFIVNTRSDIRPRDYGYR